MENKDIRDYENYKIYSDGRVFSKKNHKFLTLHKESSGYLQAHLYKNGAKKTFLVHRLVAHHFLENKKALRCVNHVDGNKLNNSASNLQWCSYSENMQHAYDTGLNHKKLTKSDIIEILNDIKLGKSQRSIAKRFRVSSTLINKIINNKRHQQTLRSINYATIV